MVTLRPATADEAQTWLGGWQRRTEDWYASQGAPGMGNNRPTFWQSDPGETYAILGPDGQVSGFLAIAVRDGLALLSDLWIEPSCRGQGYGRAARTFADGWAAERGMKLATVVATDDPAAIALVRDMPVRAQKMIKRLDEVPELRAGLTARPMTEAEYGPWLATTAADYAVQVAGAGLQEEAEAIRSAEQSYQELLPQGLATPDYTLLTLEADGSPVATNWIKHHYQPGVSFVYGVETHAEHRGRGYGRAAMLAGERATLDVGDTHLALNVFGPNTAAIRLYENMEYTVVDQMRLA